MPNKSSKTQSQHFIIRWNAVDVNGCVSVPSNITSVLRCLWGAICFHPLQIFLQTGILCFLFGQLILQRDFGTLDFRNLFLQLRLSLLGLWKHSFGLLVLLSQFFEVLQLQPSFCIFVFCALLQSSIQTLYLVFVALQFLLGTQLAVEGNRRAAICTALRYLDWILGLLCSTLTRKCICR